VTILISAQSSNYQKAVEAYNSYDYDKALDYLNRDLKDNPKSEDSYCYRALVYLQKDKNAAALSDINTAMKYTAANDKVSKAYNYFVRAKIYSKIEEYQKAIADLCVSIKNNPADIDYYIERGGMYVDVKEYSKGENDFRAALKINAVEKRAWAGIGRSYFIQEKYEEAIKVFSKLIKLSPEYPLSYYYKARANYALKNYDGAIEGLFYTLKLGDSNGLARKVFVSFCHQNYALSLSKLNAQITSKPNNAFWYLLRAEVLKKKKNYRLAIADYSKSLTMVHKHKRASILDDRAECYSELGNYPQAIADFDASLALDSTNEYTYGQRADTKRLMGNYAESVVDFSKAIAIEPNEEWFYYRRGWVKDEFMKDFQGGMSDYNQALKINKAYGYTYLNRGRLYEKQ